MDEMEQNTNQRSNIGRWLVSIIWLVLLGLMTYLFSDWLERAVNPNQRVAGAVVEGGISEVLLQRNRYGHYLVSGEINGEPVTFMLDTGASDISIPHKVADRLGLQRGAELIYSTANGRATAYAARLDSAAIGPIKLYDLRASINPNVNDEEILLGMSFLKQIEFTQRGDQLTLRQYPKL